MTPPVRRSAGPPVRFTFHLIPHTHWDREWYLTRAEFQARLVPVLDEVLDQLEADPAARFLLDGQTILLEDYLALRPEHEARIGAQVRRGALEIGPWYILSDLLVPSAHSLLRNLQEGRRQAERFGGALGVLYSPDAFGHPAALPDLAAGLGFRNAVVRRGLGRPGDFYRWEGAGGGVLLVHHLPRTGYDGAVALAREGADPATEWRRLRTELVERATTPNIAVFLGADHHAMPRGVSRLRDRIQELEAEHQVRISGLGEFFAALEQNPPEAPLVRGSLRRSRGWTLDLQDVHSTRSRLKRRHGLAELRLSRIAQPLADLAASVRGPDRNRAPSPQPILDHAWRTLLQCQFHDTLAGTTCDEVQAEQEVRLDSVDRLSRTIASRAMAELAPPSGADRLMLWNPAAEPRSGVVIARLTFFRADVPIGPPPGRTRTGPGYRPFLLAAPDGSRFPVQLLACRPGGERRDRSDRYPDQDEVDQAWVAFESPAVPGRGTLALEPLPGRGVPPGAGPLIHGAGEIGNDRIAVRVMDDGSIRLRAPRSGSPESDRLFGLVSEPDRGDLYTFSPAGRPEPVRPVLLSRRIVAEGPLVGAVETRWRAEFRRGSVTARSVIALYRDSSLVRVRLDLDHHGTDHRLRLRFPVGRGARLLAGGTIGPDLPAPVPGGRIGTAEEHEVATSPAQRWVAAATPEGILAVFAPAFFEYEWSGRGDLWITVLRAVGELSRGDLPERPGQVAWPVATPAAQEPGGHRLELALALIPPPGDRDLPSRLERLWEEAFLPVQAFFLRH